MSINKVLILGLAAITLFGCDYVEDNYLDRAPKGTLNAVDQCLQRNTTDLVENEIIRNVCTEKNQYVLRSHLVREGPTQLQEVSVVRGRASFNSFGTLEIYAMNESGDKIITALVAEVVIKGDPPKTAKEPFKQLWIPPGSGETLYIPKTNLEDLGDTTSLTNDDWHWSFETVYGVRIDPQ